MQQHPIPQNVTQYQFRLVGDMTLKQFLELAGGLVLAYLFFASNLIFIIKWPLVILSILLGAGLAFFPVEDRPLDQWVTNFIQVIYKPTRFTWRKTNKVPRLFEFVARPAEITNTITKTIKAPSVTPTKPATPELSDKEATLVKSLDNLFSTISVTPSTPPKPIEEIELAGKPTISVRKLKKPSAVSLVHLNTPLSEPTAIDHQTPNTPSPPPPTPSPSVIFAAPSAPSSKGVPATPLTTPKAITLPAAPKSPNLVTGIVVDQTGKLIANAIVQIVSRDGIPQRAMKTNSLGQFYTSTPLNPDTYVIEVDKTGLSFTPQQININNTILSPIELHATA